MGLRLQIRSIHHLSLLAATLLLVSAARSQTGWRVIGGDATVPCLLTLSEIDSLRFYAAGFGGWFYTTSDGGRSWKKIPTGVAQAIRCIHFTDRDNGIAVGDSGLYMRTTDAGLSWHLPPSNPFTPSDQLTLLDFQDAGHGITLGSGGRVFTTSDGGGTWAAREVSIPRTIYHAAALRGATGLVAGTGGVLWKTTDGGNVWTVLPLVDAPDLYAVWIRDDLTYFIAGEKCTIMRTGDGGLSWSKVGPDGGDRLTVIRFNDTLNGAAGSAMGNIYRTSDGGITWSLTASFGYEISDLRLTGQGRGVITFINRRPAYSTDGGWTWNESVLEGHRYNDVCATGPDEAIVVGESGLIGRTNGDGTALTIFGSGTGLNLYGVYCDTSEWTVVGDSGTILRSSDFGESWSPQTSGTMRTLRRVYFYHQLSGWAVGDSGTILSTVDGGRTWTPQTAPTSGNLYGICFLNRQTGFVVGEGALLRTLNTGLAWYNLAPIPAAVYRGVSSDGGSKVSVAGYIGVNPGSNPVPLLLSSTDLGITWGYQAGMFPSGGFFDVSEHFRYGVEAVGSGGRIYRSATGSSPWIGTFSPAKPALRGISFFDSLHGFIAGEESIIMHTADGAAHTPPSLLSPSTGAMLDLPASFQLMWTSPAGNIGVQVQVSEDPTFTGALLMNVIFPPSATSADPPLLAYSGRYFWRARCMTASGPDVWSPVSRFYTNNTRRVSVIDLQYVEPFHLSNATSVQNQNPGAYWWYQATFIPSAETVRISAVCSVPAGLLRTGASATILVQDPNTAAHWFSGVLVESDSVLAPAMNAVREGDLLSVVGTVSDVPSLSMNSTTIFRAVSVRVLGTADIPRPVSVQVTSFYRGSYPDGIIYFKEGEQYEGTVVVLTDLVVESILDSSSGTFNMTDRAGNSIVMADLSKWFTYRGHRDSGSAYALPNVGDHIDTIRGLVTTVPGPQNDRGYAIAPIYPGDLVIRPHSAGSISGVVYLDADGDGVRDAGEGAAAGWPVTLTGGGTTLTSYPTATGAFNFMHLDPAGYTIVPVAKGGWRTTQPGSGSYALPVGVDEEVIGKAIGMHYGGNSVSGTIFHDLNGNGSKDQGEPGMGSWPVTLEGTIIQDYHPGIYLLRTSLTDAEGVFHFDSLSPGSYEVRIYDSLYWYLTRPDTIDRYPAMINQNHTTTLSGMDFGLTRRMKLKFNLDVIDRRAGIHRKIAWGISPGASYGIWRADPFSTLIDTLEGEAEIPPRGFAQMVRIFDARFSDPYYPVGYESPHFGEGSWTDVRDFTMPSRTDTFLVSFLPSYLGGGGYPMRMQWSGRLLSQAFSGQVFLRDKYGGAIDMKTTDSVLVADTSVSWFWLFATGANIPVSWAPAWRLVSLPVASGNDSVGRVFPSALTPAFSYEPEAGYRSNTAMVPGIGYWLKHRPALDTLSYQASGRPYDTIAVMKGWNLIGSLSAPITPSAVGSDPPGIIQGPFYGYDRGYSPAEILQPTSAYWMFATGSGSLILGTGSEARIKETTSWKKMLDAETLDMVDFTDAAGNRSRFYLTADTAYSDAPFGLPPVPPAGGFDVRLATNRLVGVFGVNGRNTIPVSVSSAEYPMTVRWNMRNAPGTLTLAVGGYSVSLGAEGSAEITDPAAPLLLISGPNGGVPAEFFLDQNYPNPFNPSTTIRYGLPKESRVVLEVFDILGREVATLVDEVQDAGYKTVIFSAPSHPSGIYFYRFTAEGYTSIRKMILIK